MTQKSALQIFEQKKVRSVWDSEQEKWYISIVDAVEILTESADPRNYWKVLKHRLRAEGNESVTNCNQLKLAGADGKKYLTDVADVEQLFRLIQSIPSPKAEPFKQWLAQIATLTDIITQAWSGKTTKEYKRFICSAYKTKNPASSSTFNIRERKFPGLRCKGSKNF
ncbi:hypothetical protein AGMMS49525_07540 [Bacteroidia bacterium]|nr:hypothetical protein AGMMS49525_07540 [Bacteroidia bacterium]